MKDRVGESATIHIIKEICDGSGRRIVVQIDFDDALIRFNLNDRRCCGVWQCKQQHQKIGGDEGFCLRSQ